MTFQEILTAVYKSIIEGFARWGAAYTGYPFNEEDFKDSP